MKKYKKYLLLASITSILLLLLSGCNSGPADDETDQIADNSQTGDTGNDSNTGNDSSSQCTGTASPNDITDVILATGQSNLIGPDTTVAATLDRFGKVSEFHQPDKPHPYVFAWTVDSRADNAGTGWKQANLTQSWHDTDPGAGGIAHNNFAFHFAKQVADRSSGCRIVGIVMVSEGGKGIAHWDYGQPGWLEIKRHTGEALSAIGRSSIDGILWHQGESDWIADGTCYPESVCNNNAPDFYAQKLFSKVADPNIDNPVGDLALIDRLRKEGWFGFSKPFIAAQTVKAPVNVHLDKLNNDGDYWTATVRGDAASGLEINETDPFRNHYSAQGLRDLGARYATEYMQMKGY